MEITWMEMVEVLYEKMLSGERVKISPGTGTASSGVPVWAKGKTKKSKSTFHPFYIILILLYISYSLIQFSILKLSYILNMICHQYLNKGVRNENKLFKNYIFCLWILA